MSTKHIAIGRLMTFVIAGFLLLSSTFGGSEALAFQFDDALTSAGKGFLNAVVGDYTQANNKVYDTTLKSAQDVVNDLAVKLEKAADPNISVSDRKSLVKQINSAQKNLSDLAKSFDGYASDTMEFDSELEDTVQQLLTAVRGDTRKQLNQTESSFRQISKAIANLAADASKVDTDNLSNLLGDFGDNIQSLNQAVALGGKAVKALSAFTS
jgi:uncharacterized protein YukE